jgi:hypothetical protein
MRSQAPNNQRGISLVERGLLAAGALLFGLGFGLNYGASNQNTYLVGGLHLLHPDLLARDWLVTQTTPYHRLFAYPVAALFYLDPSGRVFAGVNLILLALGAVIIFKLIQAIARPEERLLVFVLVMLLALATRTLSVGESTLYTLEFEPSTLGVTGFLLGMYLFARNRYLLSGLAIAVGGVFHANYLILAFPTFLIAHLLVRRRGALRPLLRQFAFPAVAVVALLPIIVPLALQPGDTGSGILLSIRSPHHYVPLTYRDQFVAFLGWLLLFAAALRRGEVRRTGLDPAVSLAAAMTALIGVATVLTTFVYVPTIAEMYVWRLAPLVVLLAQMFSMRAVAGAVVGTRQAAGAGAPAGAPAGPAVAETRAETAGAKPMWLLPSLWRVGLVVVAAESFTYYYLLEHRNTLVLEVFGGILLLGLIAWVWRGSEGAPFGARASVAPLEAPASVAPSSVRVGFVSEGAGWPRSASGTVAATIVLLTFLGLGVVAEKGFAGDSNLLARVTPESQLYGWARTTPRDSVFLIPPELQAFRLSSERAVVVDWKSTPFAPAELDEWYRRIDALSGRGLPRAPAQATEGYANLSAGALANLADLYGASYAVLREPLRSAPPASWQLVFANGRYEVLRTDAIPAAP